MSGDPHFPIGSIVFAPVFPQSGLYGNGVATVGGMRAPDAPGITKRELFAALAMSRLIEVEQKIGAEFGFTPAKDLARIACSYADALLAELTKGGKEK